VEPVCGRAADSASKRLRCWRARAAPHRREGPLRFDNSPVRQQARPEPLHEYQDIAGACQAADADLRRRPGQPVRGDRGGPGRTPPPPGGARWRRRRSDRRRRRRFRDSRVVRARAGPFPVEGSAAWSSSETPCRPTPMRSPP
jgi:hypothetical protein